MKDRTVESGKSAKFINYLQKGTLLERLGSFDGTEDWYISQRQAGKRCRRNFIFWRYFIMYFDSIAKIVAERTGCDISAVRPESKFSELGIDSLDTVELLMSLEDEIGIEIDLDQKVETIADLDQFIQSKKG